MTVTMTFPMPPTRGNHKKRGSTHWRVVHRERKAFQQQCDTLQLTGGLPRPPARPWTNVVITSSVVSWNPMDDDNCMSRHKWISDWLVTRGYLVDDRRPYLRWGAIPEQRTSRSEPASITVTLTFDDDSQ